MLKTKNNTNLINDVFNYDVIIVPMSINNSMNKGFKNEIAINFPKVKEKEDETPYGDMRKYGTVTSVECGGVTFCLCHMYTTQCYKKAGVTDYVKYEALEKCLEYIHSEYKDKKIGTPIIGHDVFDGGGDKDKILSLIAKHLSDCDVTIYDYAQRDYGKDIFVEIAVLHEELKNKTITIDEYIARRSEIEWRRKHGIYTQMPTNYKYIPRKGEIIE
jgi:hypothetical protein